MSYFEGRDGSLSRPDASAARPYQWTEPATDREEELTCENQSLNIRPNTMKNRRRRGSLYRRK